MDIYQQIKKNDWYREAAGTYPHYVIYAFLSAMKHFRSGLFFKNKYGWAYINKKDARVFSDNFISRYNNDYNYFKVNWYQPWKQILFKLDTLCKNFNGQYLKTLSERDLFSIYHSFAALRLKKWEIGIIIDCFDPWGHDIIQNVLTQKKLIIAKNDLALLTGQRKLNLNQMEILERLKLALEKKRNYDVSLLIENHSKKFFWLNNNWADVYYLDSKYFTSLISKLAKQPAGKIKKEISKLQVLEKEIKRHTSRIYRQYRIDRQTRHSLELFAAMTDWRDERKMVMMKMNYYNSVILKELSRRAGLPEELLLYTDPFEPKSINQLKKNRRQIIQRINYSGLIFFRDQKFKWYCGKKAQKLRQAFEDTLNKDKPVKGHVAYPGKIKAYVKIINDPRDFAKFKRGDVMVSSMTKPDFLPIIKKASAIVTDEGGLTCHAAIVARELKIPCIIGTQNATDKFKNGDLIEVDANKGVVRKI